MPVKLRFQKVIRLQKDRIRNARCGVPEAPVEFCYLKIYTL